MDEYEGEEAGMEIDALERRIDEMEAYVATALHSFVNDPPDSDFQSGYLAALKAVATEGMGITLSAEVAAIEPPPSAPKPPHLRLVQ